MGRYATKLALAAVLAGLAGGCTTVPLSVGSIPNLPRSYVAPQTSSYLPTAPALPTTDDVADVPPGYVSFCIRFADQCQATPNAPSSIQLTDAAWRTIAKVNANINEAIWPEDDQTHYGRAEYWNIPTDGYGDCEDYALTKRKALIGEGFPQQALRIAVVDTPRNGRHAVLTVATDKGDFVLDNLRDEIVAWNATGYTWIERQDPKRPMGWVSLRGADRMIASNAQPAASVANAIAAGPSTTTR
jgi:predicted transglutaminase-like cysteine proteinase